MIIIFMGPPGSGKGTQAIKMAQRTGLAHIAVGDMLREAVKKGSELGKKAAEHMNEGRLVPDELTIEMVKERLSQKDCAKGFILDGFPRSRDQADALEEILEDIDYKVLYIDIQMDEVIARNSKRVSCRKCFAVYNLENNPPKNEMKCDSCGGELYRRDDDAPEVIRNRYTVYVQKTQPLVDYYSVKNKLIYVSGEGTIDDVFGRLLKALNIE